MADATHRILNCALSPRNSSPSAGGGSGHARAWPRCSAERRAAGAAADAEAAAAAADPRLNPLAPRPRHFPAKAKSVIWLFMNGGPSQVDTWDYKPELAKRDGQELDGFDKNTGFFTGQVGPLMKSPFKFAQHGQCGTWVAEIFPAHGQARRQDGVHPLVLHRARTTTRPALFMINTGMTRMGFPCVGSWVTYGLGSESQNLPAFVVMSDPLGRGLPKGYSQNWGAGFLPSVYPGHLAQAAGRADRQPLSPRRP